MFLESCGAVTIPKRNGGPDAPGNKFHRVAAFAVVVLAKAAGQVVGETHVPLVRGGFRLEEIDMAEGGHALILGSPTFRPAEPAVLTGGLSGGMQWRRKRSWKAALLGGSPQYFRHCREAAYSSQDWLARLRLLVVLSPRLRFASPGKLSPACGQELVRRRLGGVGPGSLRPPLPRRRSDASLPGGSPQLFRLCREAAYSSQDWLARLRLLVVLSPSPARCSRASAGQSSSTAAAEAKTGPDQVRTDDLLNAIEALCQLSYEPLCLR